MDVIRQTPQQWKNVIRIDYRSGSDGFEDWALINPPKNGDTWIVCIHGHGSHGDQLYTRQDICQQWLPLFLKSGYGILTPNLRDNAWMSPAAVDDMRELLDYLRSTYGACRFIFASGSMGGTSNLIYATLRPTDVAAVIALGAASDLASYYTWCRQKNVGVAIEIADAIENAYGGLPEDVPAKYDKHSTLKNALRLTMPVFLAHGDADAIIPVEQSRQLAVKLAGNKNFEYREISQGGHDVPLSLMGEAWPWILEWLDSTKARR